MESKSFFFRGSLDKANDLFSIPDVFNKTSYSTSLEALVEQVNRARNYNMGTVVTQQHCLHPNTRRWGNKYGKGVKCTECKMELSWRWYQLEINRFRWGSCRVIMALGFELGSDLFDKKCRESLHRSDIMRGFGAFYLKRLVLLFFGQLWLGKWYSKCWLAWWCSMSSKLHPSLWNGSADCLLFTRGLLEMLPGMESVQSKLQDARSNEFSDQILLGKNQ